MPSKSTSSRASRWLHWSGLAVGVFTLLAMVSVIAHRGDIAKSVVSLGSMHPRWLVAALGLQMGTYACVALAWQASLARMGGSIPLQALLRLSMAKLFVDQTVPTGGISGTAFLVAALSRRGVAAPASLAALVATMLGHYAAYLLAAISGLAMLWITHQARPWMAGVFAVFALISVAIPLALLALRGYGRKEPAWLHRLPGVQALLQASSRAPLTRIRRPDVLLAITALSLAVIVLDAGTLWVMLHAISLHTPWIVVFPSFLLAMMVTTIGPIPLGLGSFEATCVTALTLQGVPIEAAFTATMMLRGMTTWLPMIPGLLLARHELRKRRTGGVSGPGRT